MIDQMNYIFRNHVKWNENLHLVEIFVKIKNILIPKKRILQIVKINYQKQNRKYVTWKYIESIFIYFFYEWFYEFEFLQLCFLKFQVLQYPCKNYYSCFLIYIIYILQILHLFSVVEFYSIFLKKKKIIRITNIKFS